ncbi:hypothetical protein N9N67_11400, partial [Bacteriovoracaceae bacterium]|nr:hypothetical protein [Bacteriovoracaceae bacterium]
MKFQTLKKTVCEKIDQYLHDNKHNDFESKNKQDGSIVTQFDLAFSEIVNNLLKEQFPDVGILDEETYKDADSVTYPCFVLDPIDGTKEFANGLAQWSLSLAYLHSENVGDQKNWGMIYNPISGFLASSDEEQLFSLGKSHLFNQLSTKKFYTGVVSRTEYFDGLFDEIYLDNVAISPLG